jgi:hypothetical protein
LREPLGIVEPAVDGANDLHAGWDPVREQRLEQSIAVNGNARVSPATIRARGGAAPLS